MLSYIFYCFLVYLLYNLIFKFVLPVYRTTKQVKRSFRDMQDRMQQHPGAASSNGTNGQKTPQPKTKAGDYIDFEEVKE
jgi:hypothetical protein